MNRFLSRENCSVLTGPGVYRSGISAHSMKGEVMLSSKENLPWHTEKSFPAAQWLHTGDSSTGPPTRSSLELNPPHLPPHSHPESIFHKEQITQSRLNCRTWLVPAAAARNPSSPQSRALERRPDPASLGSPRGGGLVFGSITLTPGLQ